MLSLVSNLSVVGTALKTAKNPYSFFTEEEIARAVQIFQATWNGNIIASAKRFIEAARNDPILGKRFQGRGMKAVANIGTLIGLFVFLLVGIVLLPVITSTVNQLTSGSSPQITGTNATLLNLVPLFYILILIIVPAVLAYKMYKE